MQALHRLDLRQFRSHRRADLVLSGGPIAVFGPNGAGKTNLLEAVSLMSPGRGMRRATAAELARHGAPGWRLTGEIAGSGGLREVQLEATAGGPRSTLVDGKTTPQTALGRILRILWLTPAMDRLWIEGAEGRRRFLDRMAMSFLPEHAEAALAYEKAMRERNRLLRDGVRDARWFGALEGRMAEAGARLLRNRTDAVARLSAAQAGAATAFPAARLAVEDTPEGPLPATAEGLAARLAEGRSADLRAGRSLVGPHRSDLVAVYADKEMPAALCSTGEQKALLLSLVLANARALSTELGSPPVILLDEVAAHLDADRRATLFAEIWTLGAQAWMTGTGPELFEALGPQAQRLSVTARDGISQVERLG